LTGAAVRTAEYLNKYVLMGADNHSLREAAGAIGLTPAGLKQILLGTFTSPGTVEQLDQWYVRHTEPQDNPVRFEDPKAALKFLVELLPPSSRRQAGRALLEVLVRECDATGMPHPEWLLELKVLYEADHGTTSAMTRPGAMGKYAHLNTSSEDYARRKQEEIDLEDGRAA
jgi:hypothetical protein